MQEKRAQLQSHKIVHQEILAHQPLVESVCSRAQQLIDQTHDKSLTVYITSIRQLFSSIVSKSEQLMDRLENCVKDHTQLSAAVKTVQDWIACFRDDIQGLSDIGGEKSETKKRIKGLEEMESRQEQGIRHFDQLKDLYATVATSTSPRGCDLLSKTVSGIKDELDSLWASLQDNKKSQEAILERWKSFEDGLEANNAWLRKQESAFGDQPLQVTLMDKEAQLKGFQATRDIITGYEPEVDAFVDQATALFQSSGVERMRPLIIQISSKYQQLHVQSKEVVSKWQGIVDDHRLYEDKFFETIAWITSLEDVLESLLRNHSETNSIQNLMAEKEQASHRLGSLSSAGERLYPETASAGREKIRQDLKVLRSRWEELEKRLSDQHKSQEQQLQRLSTYQDGIVQIGIWLDMMEKCVANDQSGSQVSTLPEIRSHLLKQKTHLQDVLSHKRQMESLKERARSLVDDLAAGVSQPRESQEVQKTIDGISRRYDVLTTGLQGSIANSEWLLDVLQEHQDLEKAQSDWQEQAWAQLNANAGEFSLQKSILNRK